MGPAVQTKPKVRRGTPRLTFHLSADNLWRILTQPFYASFHPLTTLTMAFDRMVWGTWVPGFHVTQLAFYAHPQREGILAQIRAAAP